MSQKQNKILRKYAKLLGYDPESVKKEFDKESPENQKILLKQMRIETHGRE